MVYYIEYVFAENFFIDFILLFITGKLIKKMIIYRRLIIASVIGALYVILTAYIDRDFMTYFIVKFSVSILMIMVAYDSKGIIANVRVILCFYITSLIMVGIITALYYLDYDKLTIDAIVFSIFVGYAALHFFFKEIKARIDKNNYMRSVNIGIGNESKVLRAYIDTGNELADPMTGKPVIVVNIDSIRNILGDDLYNEILCFYNNKASNYENLLSMNDKNDKIKLRIVKYNTISSIGEKMVCIVPDNVEISDDDKNSINADAIIGIYPKKISQKDDYDALLFKKLLEWEREIHNEYVKSC
ncbi:MAG: sigma-E processing peptidase SpoIIGA [Sedimentibacter sp.]|uniref:sigma-E processing peptidase SpoIIGA n=1 Tax=Sedimentibacter sp. TaxID=1960295 RepID=UPI00298286C8|nr:sigma-E processing peptidase SpoIIGA [Sedimentibacter sp.]MDW5299009.1 sigma-E processing peptidase SpoIIGA [Sedimentibacter sp.]